MRILTVSLQGKDIYIFGRDAHGPCMKVVPCKPHLILGSLPTDLSEVLARYSASRTHSKYPKFNIEHAVENAEPLDVQVLSGQDITNYQESGPRNFNRVNLPDVYSWYNLRRMLREPVELSSGPPGDRPWFPAEVFVSTTKYQCPARVYNDHVSPAMQYVLEHDLEICAPGPEFSALSYDLECNLRTVNGKLVFPDSSKDPIITIGVVHDCGSGGSAVQKVVFCLYETPKHPDIDVRWFASESEMLEAFNDFLREVDPDFILGHNVNRFDNVYYRDRCKILGVRWLWSRIPNYVSSIREITTTSNQRGTQVSFRLDCPGRVVLDSYEKFRADHKLRSYKLDAIGEHFLNQRKVDMPYAQIPIKFQTPEGRLELAVYCVQDSNLVLRLVRSQCKIVNVTAMANVTGVTPDDILNRGQGIRTITLMLKYALRSSPRLFIPRGEHNEGGFKGAVVLPPLRGKYDDAVVCVDFASLYPSIMRAMNMSYETLVSRETIESCGWIEDVDVRTVPDYVEPSPGCRLQIVHNPSNCSFVTSDVREGLLPKILRELLSARSATKAEMKKHDGPMRAVLNGKQMALKVVANSIYGFTGASKGFLPEPRIASSVTKYGRGLTLRTMDIVDNNPAWKGSKVIYGDSVTGKTPVFLRMNGVIQIRAIRELFSSCVSDVSDVSDVSKQSCELNGVEVWSDHGWTDVERVIRHHTTKCIYRVHSRGSMVDVTSDHSLLLSDGRPTTAMDVVKSDLLLHHALPFCMEDCGLTYMDGFRMGVYFQSGKNLGVDPSLFKSPLGVGIVPRALLLAPLDVLYGFEAGLSHHMHGEDRFHGGVEKLAGLHYIFRRLSHRPDIGSRNRLNKNGVHSRVRVEDLGPCNDYVYDLTTSNHHFQAGVGDLIVHNTDSCFIKLSREICDGPDAATLISRAHEVGEMMANEITKEFLSPVLMEYESAFQPPFLLLKKKRYIGNLCLPGRPPKAYIKGCECVRRDFAPIVVSTQRTMIDMLLRDDVSGAKALIEKTFDDLYAGRIPLSELTLSKKLTQLPENYKSKMPHVELAKRLKLERPEKAPVAGDRVEYVIRAGVEDLNQRAISLDEVDKYVVDYNYYAEKQLRKPLERIMELVTSDDLWRPRAVTAPLTDAGIVRYLKRSVEPVSVSRKRIKLGTSTTSTTSTMGSTKPQDIRKFFFG